MRIGIVGLGLAGSSMARAIKTHPEMSLAAAADPDLTVRKRFSEQNALPVFESVEAMLTDADIDAVYIASPHQFHKQQAVLAATAGKHVIVEKPMALTLDDCDAMIAAAEKNRVVMIVGHTHSFDPAVLAMRDLIVQGEVGPVVSMAMLNYTDFLYRPRRPEELDTAAGGGVVFNQIPHQIDMARLLVGGPIRSVRAATTILDPRRPTEGGCSAFLEFMNGAVATIVYQSYDRFDSDELHSWISEAGYPKAPGRHGMAREQIDALRTPEAEAAQRRAAFGYGSGFLRGEPPHQPHFGLLIVSCRNADLRPSADGLWIYDDSGAREICLARRSWRPGRGDVLEELYRSVKDGARPVHDGVFGRGTVEASLAILHSARERCEVMLPINERLQ